MRMASGHIFMEGPRYFETLYIIQHFTYYAIQTQFTFSKNVEKLSQSEEYEQTKICRYTAYNNDANNALKA